MQYNFINNKYVFWLYLTIIMLAVTLPINSSNELNNITILEFRGDYFFHALMFIPWVFFTKSHNLNIWVWLILGLIVATGSESIQYFLSYRTFNINDLLANTIGIVLGYIIYSTYSKVR